MEVFRKKFQAAKRAAKPWHGFVLLAVAVAVVVLVVPVVLTQERKRHRAEDQEKPSDTASARVNLGYAQYQGSRVGGGVAQYLGMRYAEAPVGDLRFRAPVEPAQHSGDQKADAFGPICLGISQPYPNARQDEDCLYVNVWAPLNATTESNLPVWLFIQGGGYTANSNANWNGTAVVERSNHSIVFVNFNYRVGLWGFIASERVRAAGAGDLNAGLLDQRQVMRWVREHIAQFGGDPAHVVIHGASAGAGSVALHLLAPDEGLFVGAVGESVFFPAQPFVKDLEWQFDLLLNETGCGGDEPMDCLRGKTTEVLQAANVPSAFPGRPDLPAPLFYWTPCIDGELLRDLPYLMYERGQFVNVPVMMGITSDEGTIFTANVATSTEMAVFLRNNYPLLSSTNASAIVEQYPQMAALPEHAAWFPSAAKAYGEATFICPATHILDSYVQHRLNTSSSSSPARAWGYRYNVHDAENTAKGLGVPHLWTSWAVLGPDINGRGTGPASYYTYNAGMIPLVMDYWISFVKTLDPSALRNADAPAWEGWGGTTTTDAKQRLMMETGNLTMEMVPLDQRARCAFWKGLAPVMRQK
ncbi:Uu.00g039240.m01.CDS01 [Anthostomella pinea]|uniref:Carboxylic ester hydrolase n=1 Tax=Anthostomella pinea TaxID=933095 RepID=A0AAI8VB02_9PEZI|nr:Uu.00g039240.m01.CDS01 [Anthostomella pinea]